MRIMITIIIICRDVCARLSDAWNRWTFVAPREQWVVTNRSSKWYIMVTANYFKRPIDKHLNMKAHCLMYSPTGSFIKSNIHLSQLGFFSVKYVSDRWSLIPRYHWLRLPKNPIDHWNIRRTRSVGRWTKIAHDTLFSFWKLRRVATFIDYKIANRGRGANRNMGSLISKGQPQPNLSP